MHRPDQRQVSQLETLGARHVGEFRVVEVCNLLAFVGDYFRDCRVRIRFLGDNSKVAFTGNEPVV